MEKTTIYIVRHGESLGNLKRVMLGHTNWGLSDHGRRQATATAEHLSDVKFDNIYSSDLMRAYETVKAHADIRNMTVQTDVGLRELFVGDWEGKCVEELIERWGDMFKLKWHGGFGTFAFPNGEGVMEGGRRFYNTVLKIAAENLGKTILIGAHAAVIRAFWSIASGIAPEDIVYKLPFPTNASYSIAEYDGEKIIPLEYSKDDHLEQIGKTFVIGT